MNHDPYMTADCLLQILQEQQALLLEDSPVYLASLRQDKTDSLLNRAADTHDQDYAGGTLRAWQPGSETGAPTVYSRWLIPGPPLHADHCLQSLRVYCILLLSCCP